MIDRLYASHTRNSLRNIPSPRLNLSFNQLKIYYDEKGFTVNDSFLENLDLYTPDGRLNYVAYLMADQNSVSIKVAKYAGTDKVELMENEEYGYCSLIKATHRVLDKLEVENRTFTKISGRAERFQKRMVDARALREALINAVVHNDFTREVPPVIEFYSDRLSITSYGGLVEGLSVEEFFAGRSMPRNREIMRIYRDLDLVEQLGSGMNRILSAYSPDVFKISDNFLEVCFPIEGSLEFSKKGTPDEIPVKMAAAKKWGEKYGEKWGKNEKAVLECMEQDRKVSILAISDKTGLSPSGVEKILSRFKKRGVLRRIGPAKGGYWEIGKTQKESIPLPESPFLFSYIRRPR